MYTCIHMYICVYILHAYKLCTHVTHVYIYTYRYMILPGWGGCCQKTFGKSCAWMAHPPSCPAPSRTPAHPQKYTRVHTDKRTHPFLSARLLARTHMNTHTQVHTKTHTSTLAYKHKRTEKTRERESERKKGRTRERHTHTRSCSSAPQHTAPRMARVGQRPRCTSTAVCVFRRRRAHGPEQPSPTTRDASAEDTARGGAGGRTARYAARSAGRMQRRTD